MVLIGGILAAGLPACVSDESLTPVHLSQPPCRSSCMARVRHTLAGSAVAAGVAAVMVWSGAPAAQGGQQQPPPQQTPQQTPVFRATANAVQVDAYPTKDGRIIESLTAKDFQVYEDGKLQTLDNVE